MSYNTIVDFYSITHIKLISLALSIRRYVPAFAVGNFFYLCSFLFRQILYYAIFHKISYLPCKYFKRALGSQSK